MSNSNRLGSSILVVSVLCVLVTSFATGADSWTGIDVAPPVYTSVIDEQPIAQPDDSITQPVRLEMQPPPVPVPAPAVDFEPFVPRRRAAFNPLLGSPRTIRVSKTPAMMGDFLANSGVMLANVGGTPYFADLPTAGFSRHFKISENNRALTDDRCYFLYNHFHNAHKFQRVGPRPGPAQDANVDRYTFGVERTFFDGLWSVEARMPIVGSFDFEDAPAIRITGGNLGNLTVIVKRMFYETDRTAIAAGMGIEMPTGSDVEAQFFSFPAPDRLIARNEAVHLLPYIGIQHVPGEVFFAHGFAQLQISASGNSIEFQGADIGTYTEQNLLLLDFGMGAWLLSNPNANVVTGVASLAELHYATALQNGDSIMATGTPPGPIPGGPMLPPTSVRIFNPAGRVDVLNVTAGLHFELANDAAIRVAGVLPIGNDRYFDAEVWVNYIHSIR